MALVLVAFLWGAQPALGAQLLNASGKISFLRVQAGGGYGPPQDFIDVEVVMKLAGAPTLGVGLQLRDDAQGPAHEAMFALLRDAFKNDWTVTIDYWIDAGKQNGILHRVWVSK